MSKEDTLRRMERASAARSIREVWAGPHVALGGSPTCQPLVGKDRNTGEFIPGIRHSKRIDWGAPMPTEGEAKSIAQTGAAEWLKQHEKVRAPGVSR